MKRELNAIELENVTGGSVVITNTGVVGFTTLREMYDLQGVSWKDARNYAEELKDTNPQMSDRDFDTYVKGQFQSKGWI